MSENASHATGANPCQESRRSRGREVREDPHDDRRKDDKKAVRPDGGLIPQHYWVCRRCNGPIPRIRRTLRGPIGSCHWCGFGAGDGR